MVVVLRCVSVLLTQRLTHSLVCSTAPCLPQLGCAFARHTRSGACVHVCMLVYQHCCSTQQPLPPAWPAFFAFLNKAPHPSLRLPALPLRCCFLHALPTPIMYVHTTPINTTSRAVILPPFVRFTHTRLCASRPALSDPLFAPARQLCCAPCENYSASAHINCVTTRSHMHTVLALSDLQSLLWAVPWGLLRARGGRRTLGHACQRSLLRVAWKERPRSGCQLTLQGHAQSHTPVL